MTIRSRVDLASMTHTGRLVGLTLHEMSAAARPGMTTAELDSVAARLLKQ